MTIVVMVIGKFIDLTGLKFEKLTVISRADTDRFGNIKWLCQCECGNTTTVCTHKLKAGYTKSCGCLKKKPRYNCKNLIGKTFGTFTVVKKLHSNKHGSMQWLCVCKCGKEKIKTTNELHKIKSCGCERGNSFRINIAGDKYGKWTAIECVGTKNRQALWKCRCECGTEKILTCGYLRSGLSNSCGCISSIGETIVKKELDKHRISYIYQYRLTEVTTHKNGHPIMDFAIMFENKPLAFIEYQGIQHYQDLGWFGKYEREVTDPAKVEYCEAKRIPLFEIRYDEEIAPAVQKILSTLKLIPCQADAQSEGVTTIQ